jgi:hypothetical protein
VIAHQRRHQKIRQAQRAGGGQPIEAVVGHRGLDRRVLAAPVGQQPVEADGIDHRTGQDVGADLGALLDHHDRRLGRDLLQADRRREAGRARADDHHVKFHRLAGRQLFGAHRFPLYRAQT